MLSGKRQIGVRTKQQHGSFHTKQILFHGRGLGLTFFLRMLGTVDMLAKAARMIAIEGIRDSFRERRALRILDDHGCPCDRLQRGPMRSNRKANDQNQRDAGDGQNHVRNLANGVAEVNADHRLATLCRAWSGNRANSVERAGDRAQELGPRGHGPKRN